jgi:hypothetical protein
MTTSATDTAGGAVVRRAIFIKYRRSDVRPLVESYPTPQEAIERLKRIKHLKYEEIAELESQIDTLKGFL